MRVERAWRCDDDVGDGVNRAHRRGDQGLLDAVDEAIGDFEPGRRAALDLHAVDGVVAELCPRRPTPGPDGRSRREGRAARFPNVRREAT